MRYDVGIIGGGVIGLACAWRLAQAGARVALFERGQVGREASWAAAGMLAAQCEAAHHPPDENSAARKAMFDLCLRSRALYPAFAQELQSDTGVDIELLLNVKRGDDWRTSGILYVATRDDDPAPQAFLKQKEDGHRVEESSWNGQSATWLPDEGQVNNRLLVKALRRAVTRVGVEIVQHVGTHVSRLSDTQWNGNRVTINLGIHDSVDNVLVCAGAWSTEIGNLPASCQIPVRPVAGQILAVRGYTHDEKRSLRHIVYGSDVYLVPRRSGEILIGATMEETGFRKRNSLAGAAQLMQAACALLPSLKDFSLLDHWAGLRPTSPDGLPILGHTPVENLFVATGHFRNGILLAPITAQIMTDCILNGGKVRPNFELNRFASCASN